MHTLCSRDGTQLVRQAHKIGIMTFLHIILALSMAVYLLMILDAHEAFESAFSVLSVCSSLYAETCIVPAAVGLPSSVDLRTMFPPTGHLILRGLLTACPDVCNPDPCLTSNVESVAHLFLVPQCVVFVHDPQSIVTPLQAKQKGITNVISHLSNEFPVCGSRSE